MKKIFIVLTFIFISLASFAYNVNVGVRIPLGEQKVELDFNVKLLLGMIKAENNPKYKKLLDYIDENLAKKGEVKYSANISLKRASSEVFSENGELLYEEKLPKEFMNFVNYSLSAADDKAKVKKLVQELEGVSETIINNIQNVDLTPSKATKDLLTLTMKDGHKILVPLSDIHKKLPHYSRVQSLLTEPSIVDMEAGIFSYPASLAQKESEEEKNSEENAQTETAETSEEATNEVNY